MPAQLLTYRCPHCEHAIDVDPALAEKTVTCSNPECNKPFQLEVPVAKPAPVLIVPPDLDGRPPREPEPVRAAEPPPAPAPSEERELLTVKPLMFRRYPYRCTGYVAALAAALVGVVIWLVYDYPAVGVLGLAVGGFAGYRLLAWWLRNRTTSLTLTNKRILLKAGAFTSHSTEIAYKSIIDVQVHQGILNRMMHIGDMTLFTNMPDKKQIIVMAIPDPEGVAAEIRRLRLP